MSVINPRRRDVAASVVIVVVLFACIGTLQACPVYLTVSLDGKSLEDSFLEINWGPDCRQKPEWIGLFADDPSTSNTQPLAKVTEMKRSIGRYTTSVKVGKFKFPKGWNRDDVSPTPPEVFPRGRCLNYFVASFAGMELLAVECLKIQPNWMMKLDHVAGVPLKSLFIPGTHASGALNTNLKSTLIKSYAYSQHVDVWAQLVFGIRFLDISVGVTSKKNRTSTEADEFWIVNENMMVAPLTPVLRDINRFAKISGEVVIINFSSFPIGFYKRPDRHSDLLRLIEKELGPLAFRRNTTNPDPVFQCYDLSMDDIRKVNKNLLLIYPLQELPYPDSESEVLCPTWKTFAMDNVDTSASFNLMRLLFAKKPGSPVKDEGWIFHAVLGLEQALNNDMKPQTTAERASAVNAKLPVWFGGPWSLSANVVTVDYFTNTNIVDIAVYANLHKAFTLANKNLTRFEIVD